MNTAERGIYLYAVVPANTPMGPVPAVAQEIRLLAVGDLGFVVGSVELAELSRLNEPDADARGLAELARRHDGVVRTVMAQAASVLPFRLGTVLTDDDAVRRFATEHRAGLTDMLERLADTAEWGVRLHEESEPSGRVDRPRPAAERPGTAHLARRRAELAAAERRRQLRSAAADGVAAELRGLAVAAAGGATLGETLLDESYLVREADTSRFLAATEQLGERVAGDGLRLRVTGPWPPYSFAQLAGASRG